MSKKVRILSIDGGGIRGIIPGVILTRLETILKEKSGNPAARIADYFDFIAGTSTGGILTCLYLAPDKKKRPKYSAEQAVQLYLGYGDRIFDIPVFHRLRTQGGLTDEKYPAAELEKALVNFLGDTTISSFLKPCLITAYEITRREAFFFRQHRAKKDDAFDFFARDAARATSAAPTYFECASVKPPENPIAYALVDGGVFANNPALCAYAEVRSMKPDLMAKDMIFVSLGTGSNNLESYSHSQAKDWGLVGWARPILDILMNGIAQTVEYQMQKMFETTVEAGKQHDYFRLDAPLNGGEVDPAMDAASPRNMQRLRDIGERAARDQEAKLQQIAGLLLANGIDLA